MKQIYKKLLAAVLGVSMLLSMVGCGQNDTSDQTQTGGENEAKVLTIVTAKELDSLGLIFLLHRTWLLQLRPSLQRLVLT